MTTLNVKNFLTNVADEKREDMISRCLHSLQKRHNYSLILYEDFRDNSTLTALFNDRLGEQPVESLSLRDSYEAYAFSFISNAHSMIDCLGFSIFLMFKELKFKNEKGEIVKILKDRVTLNGTLADSIKYTYPKHENFSVALRDFIRDKNFKLLRILSNRQKHNFLPLIENNMSKLRIEISCEKNKYIDLSEFITKTHNETIVKLYNLYKMLDDISNAI